MRLRTSITNLAAVLVLFSQHYGSAFAQQPTSEATLTPTSGRGATIVSVSSGPPAFSTVVSETAVAESNAVSTTPPNPAVLQPGAAAPQLPPLIVTSAVPPASSSASPPPNPTQAAPQQPLPPDAAWNKDGVKIVPFGTPVANVNYNSSALTPGSIGFYALPEPAGINTNQFNVSPGNTYLGVDVKWPKIDDWEINGKVAFNLRGSDPLTNNNVFQPQFFHIYGEAKKERYRILGGQTEDIVSPLYPNTLNQFPIGYMAGSLGYFRPQARFETYQPISKNYTLILQGAIATPIQTFDVPGEVVARQAGVPDGQARVALGYGQPDPNDPQNKRPFELGVSGHYGRRRADLLVVPIVERQFTTWSGNIDMSFKIGGHLRFEAELFKGSVLGDYAAGIFQTFNPFRGVAIRAAGGWAQLRYRINDDWELTGGYGRDDPNNNDLFAPVGTEASRSLNEMGFANFMYKFSKHLSGGFEFSYWKTNWVDLTRGRVFRSEPALMIFF